MSVSSEALWRSSVREPYPVPGDPHALATVASTFHAYRDMAEDSRASLDSVGRSNGSWEGKAADEFHASLQRLLPNLQKAVDSFGGAGDAVGTFGRSLGALQYRADALRPRLQAAERALQGSQWQRFSPDPAARGEYARAHDALRPLLAQVAALATEYDALVRACAARLDEASHAGIRNSFGTWWAGHKDDLEKIAEVSETLSTVFTAAAVVCAVTGLEPAAGAFVLLSRGASLAGFAARAGIAAAEMSEQGHPSWGTVIDGGFDLVGVFPVLNPVRGAAPAVARTMARGQIAEQVRIGRVALAARRPDVAARMYEDSQEVARRAGRMVKPLEFAVDEGVGLVRDGVETLGGIRSTPASGRSTCP